MMRATLASLLFCACSAFEARPRPALDAWDPLTSAGTHGAPCPGDYPYLDGYDKDGNPICTARPFDPNNTDIDSLGGGLP